MADRSAAIINHKENLGSKKSAPAVPARVVKGVRAERDHAALRPLPGANGSVLLLGPGLRPSRLGNCEQLHAYDRGFRSLRRVLGRDFGVGLRALLKQGRKLVMVLLPPVPSGASSCSHLLDLGVSERGRDARVVTVGGEIDALSASELAACLAAQLAAVSLVVLDLDAVHFMGSAGLSVLFEANERATREGRHLLLVCHSRVVDRALDATELRKQFAFADTVPAALSYSC